MEKSYFLELTVEDVDYNPFTDEANMDIMPVFLDENGVNVWEDVIGNLGLINLVKVKDIVDSPEFDKVNEIITTKREILEEGKYPKLRSTALSSFPDEVIRCCERFGEKLKENSDLEIVRIKGSYSVIDSTGFIVGKIVPRYNEK